MSRREKRREEEKGEELKYKSWVKGRKGGEEGGVK